MVISEPTNMTSRTGFQAPGASRVAIVWTSVRLNLVHEIEAVRDDSQRGDRTPESKPVTYALAGRMKNRNKVKPQATASSTNARCRSGVSACQGTICQTQNTPNPATATTKRPACRSVRIHTHHQNKPSAPSEKCTQYSMKKNP